MKCVFCASQLCQGKRCTRAFLSARVRMPYRAMALLVAVALAAGVFVGALSVGVVFHLGRVASGTVVSLSPSSLSVSSPPLSSSKAHVATVPSLHQPAEPPKVVSDTAVPAVRTAKGEAQIERQAAVRKAMKHAWDGYVEFAWGKDELKPVSKSHQNWLDIGLTIVDSLDTLWIMGMKEEFQKARDWVANELSFDKNREVSTFETSIRVLGGLLSAYDLSRDPMFLAKAKDIGDRLIKVRLFLFFVSFFSRLLVHTYTGV